MSAVAEHNESDPAEDCAPWKLWPMGESALVDRLRALPPVKRWAIYDAVRAAHEDEGLVDIRMDRDRFWYRAEQLVSPDEIKRRKMVVFIGARGDGKTQGAIHLFDKLIVTGVAKRPRIFAANIGDVDKIVVHGPSGIMSLYADDDPRRPRWLKAEGPGGTLRYPNGVEVLCFSAEVSKGAVGYGGDVDLYDDVTKWSGKETAWNHARTSCREGIGLGIVATSTGEGEQELWALIEGSREDPKTLIKDCSGPATKPPTRPNIFNLSYGYYDQMATELGDTDFYRHEMLGEKTGASSPFTGLEFESSPIRILSAPRSDFTKIIVAVDPAEGKGGDHDEWGIGAAGVRRDQHCVALDDASGSYDDDEAGDEIARLCDVWGVEEIVIESNRGKRAQSTIKQAYDARDLRWREERLEAELNGTAHTRPRPAPMPRLVPIQAEDRKVLRAGPLRGFYRQGTLHHVPGLHLLEKQQREWKPRGPKRPRQDDRIDWLVHAVLYLTGLVGDPTLRLEHVEGLGDRNRQLVNKRRDREDGRDLMRSDTVSASDPRSSFRPRGQFSLRKKRIL